MHSKIFTFSIRLMGRLSESQRSEATGMLRAGSTITNAARHFNCSLDMLYQLRRRYQQTGNVSDRPRSSRPKAFTGGQVAMHEVTPQEPT